MLTQQELSARKSVARLLKHTTYIGNHCQRHPHLKGERTIWNDTCVECNKENARLGARRRRLKNPERFRANDRQWRDRNRERIREQERSRYAKNPQQYLDKHKRWRSKPDVAKRLRELASEYHRTENGRMRKQANEAKRRAAKRQTEIGFTSADWLELIVRQRICYYCRKRFTKSRKPTIDHVVPLSKGGQHVAANIVAACGSMQ